MSDTEDAIVLSVEAGRTRLTEYGVAGAIDVDFAITLPGGTHHGECTLVRGRDYNHPGFGAWGDVDHWLDGATRARLLAALGDDGTKRVLTQIAAVSGAAADRFAAEQGGI